MEIWKPIPGYEGYEASNQGRVRSVDRIIVTKRGPKRLKGRVLSSATHSEAFPYLTFQLGAGRTLTAHVAVCLAFKGPRPEGMVVRHLDNNPTNNWEYNLCYGTQKQNQADRIANGTKSEGEKHGMVKLTQEQVMEIKQRLADGEFQKDIAEYYGVTQSTVSNIKRGSRWKSLEVAK